MTTIGNIATNFSGRSIFCLFVCLTTGICAAMFQLCISLKDKKWVEHFRFSRAETVLSECCFFLELLLLRPPELMGRSNQTPPLWGHGPLQPCSSPGSCPCFHSSWNCSFIPCPSEQHILHPVMWTLSSLPAHLMPQLLPTQPTLHSESIQTPSFLSHFVILQPYAISFFFFFYFFFFSLPLPPHQSRPNTL